MSGAAGPHARKEPVLNAESTRTRAVRPDPFDALAAAGIDLETVTRELEADGVAKFAASYAAVLAGIDAKAGALSAR